MKRRTGRASTFCQHGTLERLAAGCQNRPVAEKATAIRRNYPHIAELALVKQRANASEVSSGVLCQVLVKHL